MIVVLLHICSTMPEFNPYRDPHICERESVVETQRPLSAHQITVLRSYMRQVEFGEMTQNEWFGSEWGISKAAWTRPHRKGGKYYGTEADGNPEFRRAFDVLRAAYIAHGHAEEEKAIQAAARKIRMAAPKAADNLIALADSAENETVKLRANEAILDRASAETGSKSETLSITTSLDEWRKDAETRRAAVDETIAAFDEEEPPA